jgi:hypothetical protein
MLHWLQAAPEDLAKPGKHVEPMLSDVGVFVALVDCPDGKPVHKSAQQHLHVSLHRQTRVMITPQTVSVLDTVATTVKQHAVCFCLPWCCGFQIATGFFSAE